MTLRKNRFEAGVELTPANIEGIGGTDLTREGEIDVDSDDSRLKVRVEAATRTVVTEDQTQPLTNKTINGSLNTLTNITATTNANLTGPITSVGNATSVASQTGTGSTFVMDTSPTLVTPNLGTPSAVVLTNATGTASGLTAGTVTTNANLTGAVTSVGNATSLGSFSSSDLSTALTDETGSGSAVFATSPTLVTPALGTPSALVGTNITGTASGLTAGNVTTNANLTGAITSVGNATSLGSFTSAQLATALTDETGSGANVFGTSPTITTASIVTPSRLDMKQDTLSALQTYAATAANGQLVFATDTKATYVVKDGALSAVGGAGAGINYILSPDADSGIGLWTTYADAAGISPVDGTGGSPVLTYTITTSSPLRGTSSFLITKDAANRQGNGASYDLTIDASDKGKVLQCSFEYQIASGTFADNDLSIWIYDVTNAVMIQPAPYLIKNSGIIEKFAVEFQTAINSTSYRLIIHCASTSAVAYTVKLDNFNLGPQAKLYGSAITDWVSFTPTGSWTSNVTYTGRYRRVGDTMEIGYKVTATGVPGPAATALTFNMPTGFSIDTSKIAGSQSIVGSAAVGDSGVTTYDSAIYQQTATSFGILQNGAAGTYVNQTASVNSTSGVPIVFGAADYVEAVAIVPIVGWSSSQIMSNDADTRVVDFYGTKGSTQSVTANVTDISFTSVKDSHSSWNGSQFLAPVSGDYMLTVATGDNGATSQNLVPYVNGSSYSQRILSIVAGAYTSGTIIVTNVLAGQTISVRSTATTTIAAAGSFSIAKISGPSQIAASESVSALYTGAPPTGTLAGAFNKTTYGTKVKDSHNAYASGLYTVPVSGTYSVSASNSVAATYGLGNATVIAIAIDGTASYSSYTYTAGAVGTVDNKISVLSIPLLVGQTISVQTYVDGSTPSFTASSSRNILSIVRTGNY